MPVPFFKLSVQSLSKYDAAAKAEPGQESGVVTANYRGCPSNQIEALQHGICTCVCFQITEVGAGEALSVLTQ